MAEKKQPRSIVIPAPIWLISFGDTIALMLAFFVMLYSMSSLQQSKFTQLISALKTEDIEHESLFRPTPNSNYATEYIRVYNGLSLSYVYELLNSKLQEFPEMRDVGFQKDDYNVTLVLPEWIFAKGSNSEISDKGMDLLLKLGLVLAPITNLIHVEGHAVPQVDDPSLPYSNRWVLRLSRAAAVAQAIRESGLLSSIKIYGWPKDKFTRANQGENQTGSSAANIFSESDTEGNQVQLRITGIAGGQ